MAALPVQVLYNRAGSEIMAASIGAFESDVLSYGGKPSQVFDLGTCWLFGGHDCVRRFVCLQSLLSIYIAPMSAEPRSNQ